MAFGFSREGKELAGAMQQWRDQTFDALHDPRVAESVGLAMNAQLLEVAHGAGTIIIDTAAEIVPRYGRSSDNGVYLVPLTMEHNRSLEIRFEGEDGEPAYFPVGACLDEEKGENGLSHITHPALTTVELIVVAIDSTTVTRPEDRAAAMAHEFVHVYQFKNAGCVAPKAEDEFERTTTEAQAYDVQRRVLDPYYDGKLTALIEPNMYNTKHTVHAAGDQELGDRLDGSIAAMRSLKLAACNAMYGYVPDGVTRPPAGLVDLYKHFSAIR